jgi:hypothetical protein
MFSIYKENTTIKGGKSNDSISPFSGSGQLWTDAIALGQLA